MGQMQRSVAADQYGLARVNRERRWTVIVDLVLVVATLGWLTVLRVGTGGSGLRWGVSLVLLAMIVHRVLLLAERLRRRHRTRPAGSLADMAMTEADPTVVVPGVVDPGATAA